MIRAIVNLQHFSRLQPSCPHPRNNRNRRSSPFDYLGGPSGRQAGFTEQRPKGDLTKEMTSAAGPTDLPQPVGPSLIRRAGAINFHLIPINCFAVSTLPVDGRWDAVITAQPGVNARLGTRATEPSVSLSVCVAVCRTVFSRRRVGDRCDTKLHEN